MSNQSDREHAELLMLYKIAIDDIDRAKREQWTQFYAVILAQVGVVGLSLRNYPNVTPWSRYALGILLFLGFLVIFLHQYQLHRLRGLIETYATHLDPVSQTLRKEKKLQGARWTFNGNDIVRFVPPAFMCIVLIGVSLFLAIFGIP